MITPYFPEESKPLYSKYYNEQVQYGNGVFRGETMQDGSGRGQKGHGFGSFISNLGSMAKPFFQRGAKALLRTGLNIASDVIKGKNVGASAKDRFKETGSGLLSSLSDSMSGPPRKRRRKAPTIKRKNKKGSRSLFRNVDVSS